MEERHHLIPRAYGGVDGPQVSLCDKHHMVAHKIAICLKAKKPFEHLLVGESEERRKKLIWMASLIVKADRATAGDENKPSKVTVVLSKQDQAMLDHVKTAMGISNRPDVFLQLLRKMYSHLKDQT